MTVTPTGMLSEPLSNLRAALSQCAAFRTWVGADTPTEALDSVALIEGSGLTRPFAVIDHGDMWEARRLDGGGTFHDQGTLFLLFEEDVAEDNQNSEADAVLSMSNTVGAILEELWTLSPGVFDTRSIALVSGPLRSDDKERKQGEDYVQMIFQVRWG